MRRMLMFLFVVFFMSLVPVASAATSPAGTSPAAVSVAGGGFSLAEAVYWVRTLWEATADAVLPPPGVTNGSCVDPDGSTCHSHG